MAIPRNREYDQLPAEIRALIESRPRNRPYPDALKQLILAAPLTISNAQLSKRYRLSMRQITLIRRAAGMYTAGMKKNAHLPGLHGWRGQSDATKSE